MIRWLLLALITVSSLELSAAPQLADEPTASYSASAESGILVWDGALEPSNLEPEDAENPDWHAFPSPGSARSASVAPLLLSPVLLRTDIERPPCT